MKKIIEKAYGKEAGVYISEDNYYEPWSLTYRKDGKSYSYKDLQVANTNELFIQNVARVTGAPTITKRKPRPGWKPVYVCQLRRHESVLNILRQVIPYLIIKKGTAEAMLQ